MRLSFVSRRSWPLCSSSQNRPAGLHSYRTCYNKYVVTEKTKEALVFHDGKNAHLIIQTQLQSDKAMPSSLAWVIPLPSLPVRYEEADPELFKELLFLTEPKQPGRMFNPLNPFQGIAGGAQEDTPDIKVHRAKAVGSYKIQPIEILNDTAGEALNRWLMANGFGAVPAENQRHYLKKGAVFLALKLGHLQGSAATVKPLHIVYPADRLSVPLKFSSHSGVFDLLLYTFTPKQPDVAALEDFHLNFIASVEIMPHAKGITRVVGAQRSARGVQYSKDGDKIGGLLYEDKGGHALFKLLRYRAGYLSRFSGEGFNAPGKSVRDLADDPYLLPDGSANFSPMRLVRKLLPFMALAAVLAALFLVRRRLQKPSPV